MDKPEQGESSIQFYRRKNDFANLMLNAWSSVEYNVDQLVAREFGLPRPGMKEAQQAIKLFQLLRRVIFDVKRQFLYKNGVLTKEESVLVQKFQQFRNELFHGNRWDYMIYDEKLKAELMDNAVKVANLIFEVLSGGKHPPQVNNEENANVPP